MGGTCSKQLSTSPIVSESEASFTLADGTAVPKSSPEFGGPVVNHNGYAWEKGQSCQTDTLATKISLVIVCLVLITSSIGAWFRPIVCLPVLIIILLSSLMAVSTNQKHASSVVFELPFKASHAIADVFVDEP